MNILLLEDNKTDADLTCRELTRSIPNCNIQVAQTLQQAKTILQSGLNFGIALLDMKLPDGNGLEILMEIKQSKSDMPVLILTGSGNEEVAVVALKAGASDYIIKRKDYISNLPKAINSAINNHQHNKLLMSEIINVLYIEHHSSDIDLTRRHLSQFAPNIHLSAISTAEEALKILPQHNSITCDYHLILLDYRLPGLNALEFTKIIRQERKLLVPIILVTGHGNEEIAIEALKFGVNDYLVKRENYLQRLPSLILSIYQHYELVRKQLELAESESKYRLLAENSADVIFTLNLDLNYTYVSPSIKTLRGFIPEEVICENIANSLTPKSYEKATNVISSKLKEINASILDVDKPVIIELEMVKKDKSTVWTEVKATFLLDENKKPKGILGVTRDISSKKLYEAELYRSREEYKQFFEDDLTGDYIATVEGKLLNCNPAYLQILGIKSKEKALSINLFKTYKNPKDREVILDLLRKHGRLINHEYELVKTNGETVYVIANLIGQFNSQNKLVSTKGYIIDNTKRKLATDSIRKLSQAVEQSPVSIIITDTNGNIEYANSKVFKITGYKKSEILGKNPRIFNSGEKSSEEYKTLWDTISSGKEWFGEFHNKKKNGELFWESTSISPIINENGEVSSYVAVKEDITNRKLAEEELIQAKEQAEESNRLKSAFLANLSHEIRTPMNSIIGFSSLLPEEKNKEKRIKFVNTIISSSEHLLHIIDDIVFYSKLQTKLVSFDPTIINVHQLFSEIEQEYTLPEFQKGVTLKIEIKAEKPVFINADYDNLKQILNNLISNAFKYTNSGTITIGYLKQKDSNLFYVSDTGIGIPVDEHEKVFDRFYRGSNVNDSPIGGTGLGLSIVKELVELHNGEFWLESKIETGTTFYFTIP